MNAKDRNATIVAITLRIRELQAQKRRLLHEAAAPKKGKEA